jgi:hypothetical protein
MNIAPKARVAIIAALATALLTGCSTADAGVTADPAPEATAEQAQTQPEDRWVTVVTVVDPTTVVVTPVDNDDSLYGTNFTVQLNDVTTVSKGECGYEETLARATHTLTEQPWSLDYDSVEDDVWIDAAGKHHGYFNSIGALYGQIMAHDGFAYLTATQADGYLGSRQEEVQKAQDAGRGLWASCPGFGA